MRKTIYTGFALLALAACGGSENSVTLQQAGQVNSNLSGLQTGEAPSAPTSSSSPKTFMDSYHCAENCDDACHFFGSVTVARQGGELKAASVAGEFKGSVNDKNEYTLVLKDDANTHCTGEVDEVQDILTAKCELQGKACQPVRFVKDEPSVALESESKMELFECHDSELCPIVSLVTVTTGETGQMIVSSPIGLLEGRRSTDGHFTLKNAHHSFSCEGQYEAQSGEIQVECTSTSPKIEAHFHFKKMW